MAVIREKIVLRKRRTSGERLPNRVRLDKIGTEDTLIVEIVVDKKNGVVYWYRFLPEQLTGKKSVIFTISGSGKEVYWLSGAKPDRIYQKDLPEEPQSEPITTHRDSNQKPNTEPLPQADPGWRKRPRVRKVMVFDAEQNLAAVFADLKAAAGIIHILPDSIDKLCKSKKPSQDTGLSFRYIWKKLDFDLMDFRLPLTRYDKFCKREAGSKETKEEVTP